MMGDITELARCLAGNAETVCRAYLSHGRRAGRYWSVGDIQNSPGRSLYVRLDGPRAGKWADAATGEHGDLLDLIAIQRGVTLREAASEARAFLALSPAYAASSPESPVIDGSGAAARRLFAAGRPVTGTLAETYLRQRGIVMASDWPCLRYHPAVWYRPCPGLPRQSWPALLAAVTDGQGILTGIQRTYLDPRHAVKAPLPDPRRALGQLRGHAVRFGVPAGSVLAAGEGVETVLALKSVLPDMPMAAALSATHLAALAFTPGMRRCYVMRDNDAAGCMAVERLLARGREAGLDMRMLVPLGNDFNADLQRIGSVALRAWLIGQLAPADAQRFPPIRALR